MQSGDAPAAFKRWRPAARPFRLGAAAAGGVAFGHGRRALGCRGEEGERGRREEERKEEEDDVGPTCQHVERREGAGTVWTI